MTLQIITADQRMAEKKGHKIVVCGASGVGKTTLARTLNAPTTLFMDLEAGDAAIEGHPIDVVRPRTWAEFRYQSPQGLGVQPPKSQLLFSPFWNQQMPKC